MILRLSAALFQVSTPKEGKQLLALLHLLLHQDDDPQPIVLRLEPEDAEIDESGAALRWLAQHHDVDEGVRERLELGRLHEAVTPFTPPGHRSRAWRRAPSLDATVEPRAKSDWPNLRLTLGDALDLVKEPLHLRYEDELNDPKFIGWLAEPSQRQDLGVLMGAPGRIQVHGGGTGGIKRWLNEHAATEALSPEQQRRLW